ncbi:DsbA family protein [Patescibacteria group bacterium]|nr:DsbA family protein [Patescibacteria group bacterium]
MNGEKKFVIGIILSTIVILVGAVWFLGKSDTNSNSIDKTSTLSQDQQKLLEVVDDDYLKGNKEAKVTIVEYLDFECEACGAYYPLVKSLMSEFGQDIRFVTRYFPLPGHKNSMPAALAVEAAAKQGKYWEMHDLLFTEQRSWGEKKSADPKIFEEYAKKLGLNMAQYDKDVNSKEAKARVERDKNAGNQLGIFLEPTFFVNGSKIPNPKGLEDFKTFIKAELQKSAPSDRTQEATPSSTASPTP